MLYKKVGVEPKVNKHYHICLHHSLVPHINFTIQTIESRWQFRDWERDKTKKTLLRRLFFYTVYSCAHRDGFFYFSSAAGIQLYIKLNLLNSWGRLEMMGPYPGALSYNSNNGAATSL